VANFASLAAVGHSLERLLTLKFSEAPVPVANKTTRAVLVRTEDLDPNGNAAAPIIQRPALSIFVYRVDFNKTMRAAWSAVGHQDGRARLPLDLHFLLTPWADNAEAEHAILGRAMQVLETTPILSGPLLHASGDWAPGDAMQVVMEEISTEAVMRTFDSLPVDYHLSVPYLARVIRIDAREATVAPHVTTAVTGLTPASS
jgi:hypothetical protein